MKVHYTFPNTKKDISKNIWTSFGICSAESLRGINIFKISKMPLTVCKFESTNTLLYTNKMEEYQMDPIGSITVAPPPGDKLS